jgi:hypothetical protein
MGNPSRIGKTTAIGCGVLFGTVWILGWSAGTLFFAWMTVRGIVMQARAADFPSTQGTVLDSRVETHHDNEDGTSYTAKARYAYVVHGHRYESGKLRFGMTSGGRKASESFVRQHPPGSPVTVFYDPANPALALLEPGVSGIDLFAIIFLTPFLIIMLCSWTVAFRAVAGPRDAQRRFARRLAQDGAATVVQMPGLSPFGAAGLTALGTSFALVFIVGFSTGMRPSLAVCGTALVMVIVAAIWVGRRTRAKLRQGVRQVAINPIRRTITLPLRKRQTERDVIRFDQIDDVDVKRRVRTGEDSTMIDFAPTLRWIDSSGTNRTTALGFFDREDEARAMRDWLLQKIGRAPTPNVTPASSAADQKDPIGT